MIGLDYTPDLLAALVKTPDLTGLDVAVSPDGRKVGSYKRRYMSDGLCETTYLDSDGTELTTERVRVDLATMRFGFAVRKYTGSVSVRVRPGGLDVVFTTHGMFADDECETCVVGLPSDATVTVSLDMSEYGSTEVVEKTVGPGETVTSFYEHEGDEDPWLMIVEPD